MKPWMWMSAGVGVMMAAGVAVAQVPPTPPAGAPPAPNAASGAASDAASGPDGDQMGRGPMHDRMHGPDGMRGPEGMMMMRHMEAMHRPPPSKAARFVFRKGDAFVSIKCADDENMKACVDAGSALLDKLAAQPK